MERAARRTRDQQVGPERPSYRIKAMVLSGTESLLTRRWRKSDDVVIAAVERQRAGEPGQRALCRRIRRGMATRHLRRDRSVVDDAPALRLMVLTWGDPRACRRQCS